MKKTGEGYKFRWKKISYERWQRKLLRESIKKDKAKASLLNNAISILAPVRVLLQKYETHSDVTNFLSELREKIEFGASKIILDFTRTKIIYAGAGLLMYAELQRIIDLYPDRKFICRASRTNRVNQVLQHLNIFKMLNYSSKVVPNRADVVNWRHARADQIDCTGAGTIIEAYASLSQPVSRLLYKAASEAISNAINHAYDAPRGDGLRNQTKKSWWMFCREDAQNFYMSVCDLGVGIPNTLSAKNAPELIAKVLEKISFGLTPSDAQMIYGAMEYARTRTDRPYQGKGLMDLRKIIEDQGVGRLAVYSNSGCVQYEVGKGYQLFTYDNSIRGTLIVWSIPLPDKVV